MHAWYVFYWCREFHSVLLARSFATLNAQPDPSMVDALGKYVASECRGENGVDEVSIAKLFGQRQELANLAWSCAVSPSLPSTVS